MVWGDEIKAEMEVVKRIVYKADGSVLPLGLPDAGMFVQNNELYNKLYGQFGSTSVVDGDSWQILTKYKISCI